MQRLCGGSYPSGLKKIIKCEITEASDGIDAISKLKEKFDLVITDLRMPRADGLKVVEHIRENMDDALTPIIIVTTVASGDDKERRSGSAPQVILQSP